MAALAVSESSSSPIPLPAMLRDYNDVTPELGTQIATEWLNTVRSERVIAENESAADIGQAKNGQAIAAWLAIICVFASIAFGLRGQVVQMGVVLSPPLLVLIGQFIWRRRS